MEEKKLDLSNTEDNVKGLVEAIGSKVSRINYDKGKEIVSDISKNIKDSFIENLHYNSDRAASFIKSFRKDKLKNLEKVLNVTKKDCISTNKQSYIYRTGNKRMIIVDRDIWGEPCSVTFKDGNEVELRVVKFFENIPYLFPVFNEKNVSGDIVFMSDNEIWYKTKDEALLVLFRRDKIDYLKISLSKAKDINNKNLLGYLESCKMLYLEKRLNDILIVDRGIKIEDIVRIKPRFAIYRNSEKTFSVLLFDDSKNMCDEFTLSKLPTLSDDAWEVLFSDEIVNYVKTKGYFFENFKQDIDHLEYWENLGTKKICVMRCKIG